MGLNTKENLSLPHLHVTCMSLQVILDVPFCVLTKTCQRKSSAELPFEMSVQLLEDFRI